MSSLKQYVRRYTSIAAMLDILRRGELPLLNPDSWDDRNDRYFMARYKEAKGLNGLYALCAAQCSETYHHWRVFTGATDGACLELRREPLEHALGKLDNVRFGPVDYLRLEEVDSLTSADVARLPFVKRQGFAAEEEYRIILESDEVQGPAMSIELPRAFIGRVYLNPWLPASLAESIIDTVRGLPGCKTLSIQRSHLIDSARWKRAGDRVTGAPPAVKKRVLKLKAPPKSKR